MEQLLNEIRVSYLDTDINALLSGISEESRDIDYSVGFTQGEEQFLDLTKDFFVPRLPIHHDVRVAEPSLGYIRSLKDVVAQLVETIPASLQGLTYYFDPAEILKPCFFRLYKVEGVVYLYHLRIDLSLRPFGGEVLEKGSNDITSAFRTRRLYIESEIIPLDAVMWEMGKVRAFRVKQLVSNTWIGESGRGYMVRGIWMDAGLTKFFSKLVLPDGTRIYPYYPLSCKYKTICATTPRLGPDCRKRLLPLLHRAISFLVPEMERIQAALKTTDFSEKMPEFLELRRRVPPAWQEILAGAASKPYLNERDMKEFSLEVPCFVS
jgi:hypothetical protein